MKPAVSPKTWSGYTQHWELRIKPRLGHVPVDEITREHLNDETQQLFQREGFAGLFITHSISEAVFMSTRVLVMSARPGRIVAEYQVPFDYPRDPDLRFDPEFARLSGEISHALRGSHS